MYSSLSNLLSASGSSLSSSSVSPPLPLSPSASSSLSFPQPPPSHSHAQAFDYPTTSSLSSLDERPVFRGVVHDTRFAPAQRQQDYEPQLQGAKILSLSGWQDSDERAGHHESLQSFGQPKQFELHVNDWNSVVPSVSAAASSPVSPVQYVLPAVPMHVERFTSFYSHATPAVMAKAIRMGLKNMSEFRVEINEQVEKCKFRCSCYSEGNQSIDFIARVYSSPSAPAPYLVEFQRRCGDSVSFYRMYQKAVKSMQHIVAAQYENAGANAFQVPAFNGWNGSIKSNYTPCFEALPMPAPVCSMQLDLPTVSSLCQMLSSDCVEVKRESAQALARVAKQHDLFAEQDMAMPSLSRAVSQASAQAAAAKAGQAIWAAIVNVITSSDAECCRLGTSILKSCLAHNHTGLLTNYLQAEPALVQFLVSELEQAAQQEESEEVFGRHHKSEIKKQIALVLGTLLQKKGSAFLDAIAPRASFVIAPYMQSQQ